LRVPARAAEPARSPGARAWRGCSLRDGPGTTSWVSLPGPRRACRIRPGLAAVPGRDPSSTGPRPCSRAPRPAAAAPARGRRSPGPAPGAGPRRAGRPCRPGPRSGPGNRPHQSRRGRARSPSGPARRRRWRPGHGRPRRRGPGPGRQADRAGSCGTPDPGRGPAVRPGCAAGLLPGARRRLQTLDAHVARAPAPPA
jgi:hypothetical protein